MLNGFFLTCIALMILYSTPITFPRYPFSSPRNYPNPQPLNGWYWATLGFV
jgi:hypothetical protein